jgi:hypothetical protein
MPSAARISESEENRVSSKVRKRGRERAVAMTSSMEPMLAMGSPRSTARMASRTALGKPVETVETGDSIHKSQFFETTHGVPGETGKPAETGDG